MIGQVLTPDEVKQEWYHIAPYLRMAVEKNDGELLLEDIPGLVASSRMFIGVIREKPEAEILYALAGEVIVYPRKKVLNVAFVGGRPLVQSRSKHLYPALEGIARLLDCTCIQGQCGPGAARFFSSMFGLVPTYTVLRREVGPG